MLESFLAIVALAQVESELVLRRADFSQDVVVSLPLQERVTDARVAIVRRVVQWSPLAVVLCVDVRSVLQKHEAGI